MLTLPEDIVAVLVSFAPLFSRRVWRYVPVLVVGALLAPGRRMVSTALRCVGLGEVAHFQNYHRVLNRAVWSSRRASRLLLGLLVRAFATEGPLVLGIDETIERRRGTKIAAAGIYRDPVRSSRGHFVKVNGLRWIAVMLLVPIPWAGRVWARQLIRQVHRWLPERHLVVVGDSAYATLDLLAAVRPIATMVTRLRLDAQLFAPAPPRAPHQRGRPRRVGARLPTLEARRADSATVWTPLTVAHWYGGQERTVEIVSQTAVWYHTGLPPVPIRWVLIRDPEGHFPTQALLCTDLEASPSDILAWFVQRWQLEVTFHELRAHLGVETQRQWAAPAIARTTPVLFGLFSLVTLLAHPVFSETDADQMSGLLPHTAWYAKTQPTFADALALVRRRLWASLLFQTSAFPTEHKKITYSLFNHVCDLLCYAA